MQSLQIHRRAIAHINLDRYGAQRVGTYTTQPFLFRYLFHSVGQANTMETCEIPPQRLVLQRDKRCAIRDALPGFHGLFSLPCWPACRSGKRLTRQPKTSLYKKSTARSSGFTATRKENSRRVAPENHSLSSFAVNAEWPAPTSTGRSSAKTLKSPNWLDSSFAYASSP